MILNHPVLKKKNAFRTIIIKDLTDDIKDSLTLNPSNFLQDF